MLAMLVKVLPFCQEWLPSDQYKMLNNGLKLLCSVSVKTYLKREKFHSANVHNCRAPLLKILAILLFRQTEYLTGN